MFIKTIVILLFIIGAFLDFFKVEMGTWRISLRGDLQYYLSGIIFGLIALLIWLFS